MDKSGFTAYALYQNINYGVNAEGSRFTGSNTVFTLGYLVSDDKKINLQPYLGFNLLNKSGSRGFENTSGNDLLLGVNLLHLKSFLRTTLEYQKNTSIGSGLSTGKLIIQMQFLI